MDSSRSARGSASSSKMLEVTHSREKIKLCIDVLLDHFGPVAARVGATLLQRGRLTLKDITRFLSVPTSHPSSGLDPSIGETPSLATEPSIGTSATIPSTGASAKNPIKSHRLIQHALLTLIQHNVCWHVCLGSDQTMIPKIQGGSGIEYFELNVDEVLSRTRFGTYLAIVDEEWGGEAYEVVLCLLRNGKLQPKEVVRKICGDSEHPLYDQGRADTLYDLMRDLLLHYYLQPSMPIFHTSSRDRKLAYEASELRNYRKVMTPKERQKITEVAQGRARAEEEGLWRYDITELQTLPSHFTERKGLLKRATKRSARSNGEVTSGQKRGKIEKEDKRKRSKESNGRSRSSHLVLDDEDGDENGYAATNSIELLMIDPDLFLRVNYDRFDIHIRDQIIFRAVEARHNTIIAEIMRTMVTMDHRIRPVSPSIRDETSELINIHNLRESIPSDVSIRKVFDRDSMRNILGSEPTQFSVLSEIMALLTSSDHSFSQKTRFVGPALTAGGNQPGTGGSKSASNLKVQYGNTAVVLREQLLRNVVESQFGSHGARIMALLRDEGKLEEKHISKRCLISTSETRDICARLFASSLLSLQEVPRSSDRTAARTVFLWYVDPSKCMAWLADHLYKTMSRMSQRRREELRREWDLERKVRRTDLEMGEMAETLPGQGPRERALSLMGMVERRRYERMRGKLELLSLGEMRTMMDLFLVQWGAVMDK